MPKQNKVTIHIVTKPDEELEFFVKENIRGQELFDLVCRAVGLRESYYFGMHYKLENGDSNWLRMNKKIRSQLGNEISSSKLYLKVEYYPIDIETGLILQFTRQLFFQHVKSEILSENIYCPAEEAILLASYAVQAKYGDFDRDTYKKGYFANEQLLPNRVLMQYRLSTEEWEETIIKWYSQHQGFSRGEAEIEYLKTAQNLEMYGVDYYRIQNDQGTELWLGIHATGINIYEADNQLIPKVSFIWTEIKNISFKSKQIWIRPMEEEVRAFNFNSLDVSVNREILSLCTGNHDLYMKSKREDSLEVEIMKSQAQELRKERQREQNRFYKERKRRMKEREMRIEMEEKLHKYQSHIEQYRIELEKAEETTDLLAQKALVAEEEAKLLLRKAADLESETENLKMKCMEKDQEKNYLQSNIERAEMSIKQIIQESQNRAAETQLLRQELDKSRQHEKRATDKLLQITSGLQMPFMTSSHQQPVPQLQPANRMYIGTYVDEAPDMKTLQQEKVEYFTIKTHLERQLTELKAEIEGLKISGNHDVLDQIHRENVGKGETKFSTLQKLQATSTNSRVQAYQRL